MSEIVLSISILVSGREETTIRCLDSLKELRDEVACELILVDTGCSPKLWEQVKGYGDQLLSFSWCNDFAKARNVGLEAAKGEWFMFLDDDEWFEDTRDIIRFFQSKEYLSFDQAVYKVRNYGDREGKTFSDDWVSRVIKREEDTHFEGRVHESLVPAKGHCKQLQSFVHHYGYVFDTDEERLSHYERNVSILEALLKEEPDDMRWRLQLLQEYESLRDGEKLKRMGEDSLQLIQEIDQSFVNQCRGAFSLGVLKGDMILEAYGDVMKAAHRFLEDGRHTNRSLAAVSYYGANAAEHLQEWEELLFFSKGYAAYYEAEIGRERDEQQRIIEESIIFVKDVVSSSVYEEMILLWGRALVCLERQEEFPIGKTELILGALRRFADGNGEFLLLPEDIRFLAEGGILPVGEVFARLPLSQWMAMVFALEARNNVEDWEKAKHVADIGRLEEDIRYLYFDMHYSIALLGETEDTDAYDVLRECLLYFTNTHLQYIDTVYTDAALRDGMELLEDSAKAAVHCCSFFDYEEQKDWNGMLEALGKAAKVFPKMGTFVKRFAVQIGAQQEHLAKQAKEANDELQAMAQEVKQQIRYLMDAGMYSEALNVLKQVRQLLPKDRELKKLEQDCEKQV